VLEKGNVQKIFFRHGRARPGHFAFQRLGFAVLAQGDEMGLRAAA
jgi:hypothetical protein